MKEQLISFEAARLAKEKGFNELCDYHYCYGSGDKEEPKTGHVFIGGFVDDSACNRKYKNSELVEWDLPYGEFSAPTQSFLQKWLRDNFAIEIAVQWFDKCYINAVAKQPFKANTYRIEGIGRYEDALEIALIKALKMI